MSYLDIPGVTGYIVMFNDISYGFMAYGTSCIPFPVEFIFAATPSEICWQNQLLVCWFGVEALGDETRGSCSTLAKNSSKPIGGGVLEGWKMYRELLLEQSRHCHVVVAVTRNFDYQRIFPG